MMNQQFSASGNSYLQVLPKLLQNHTCEARRPPRHIRAATTSSPQRSKVLAPPKLTASPTRVIEKRQLLTTLNAKRVSLNAEKDKMRSSSPLLRKDFSPDEQAIEAQKIALSRAVKALEKQRFERANNPEEVQRRARSMELEAKNSQRQRFRAEIYCINALLRKIEREKFDDYKRNNGQLPEVTDDDYESNNSSDGESGDDEKNENKGNTRTEPATSRSASTPKRKLFSGGV